MTGEKCRHCGGRIEYVEWRDYEDVTHGFWKHLQPPLYYHEAAPAFGGGS